MTQAEWFNRLEGWRSEADLSLHPEREEAAAGGKAAGHSLPPVGPAARSGEREEDPRAARR